MPTRRGMRANWADTTQIAMLWFVQPLLAGIDGGGFADFDAACVDIREHWRWTDHQRLSWIADFVVGARDEAAFASHPCQERVHADLAFAKALRAELHERRDEAAAAWRAYLATPRWARSDDVECATERLARWRLRELAGR